METLETAEFKMQATEMAELVRSLAQKGLTPATSTNYSFRLKETEHVAVSRSGVDKEKFTDQDMILVDLQGMVVAPSGAKQSAETLLHTMIYRNFDVGSILHSHSVLSTVLSKVYREKNGIHFQGYEVLKGLNGVESHEESVFLPIFPNSQNMGYLSQLVESYLLENRRTYGFLIEGHGLYAWGKDIKEAKRHLEVYEFLFQCLAEEKRWE